MIGGGVVERLVVPVAPDVGPWAIKPAMIPKNVFGKGCIKPFDWYFKGKSSVKVKSLEDICRWLMQCKYVLDEDLFFEEDFWQHPITFETTRKGDCEDHALWAWRKLAELKYETHLVSGMWQRPEKGRQIDEGHVWVIFRKDVTTAWKVLEATAKQFSQMVFSTHDASSRYRPKNSVCQNLQTYYIEMLR